MTWVYFIFGVLLLTTISYTQEIASENSIRMRRSVADVMPGQYNDLDPTDKKVIDLAKYSLEKYERKVGFNYELVKVIRATEQITAGMTYKLNFYAKPLLCQSKPSSNCPEVESMNILNCHSQVWSRPWLQVMDEVSIDCKNEYPVGY